MKNFLFGLSLTVVGALTGCRETSKLPEPAFESLPLLQPEFSTDTAKTYYDYRRARISRNSLTTLGELRPVFEFVINPTNRDVKIRTIEVYKSFGTTVGTVPTFKAPTLAPLGRSFNFGPRVKVGEYSSFPATVTVRSDDAIADLPYIPAGLGGRTQLVAPINDGAAAVAIAPGTAVVFTFEYVLEDGRRIILTPLDSRGAITGTFAAAPYAAVALFKTLN